MTGAFPTENYLFCPFLYLLEPKRALFLHAKTMTSNPLLSPVFRFIKGFWSPRAVFPNTPLASSASLWHSLLTNSESFHTHVSSAFQKTFARDLCRVRPMQLSKIENVRSVEPGRHPVTTKGYFLVQASSIQARRQVSRSGRGINFLSFIRQSSPEGRQNLRIKAPQSRLGEGRTALIDDRFGFFLQ